MKRALSFLALFLMLTIFSSCTPASASYASDRVPLTEAPNAFSYPLSQGQTVGLRFNVDTPLGGLEVSTEELDESAFTIYLYRFDTSYDDTVASSPLLLKRRCRAVGAETVTLFFEALEAGDYLAVLQADTDVVFSGGFPAAGTEITADGIADSAGPLASALCE